MLNLEMLPSPGSPALGLVSWLLTYAVHSTLLGATAWLATGLLHGHAMRETLWKAALVGGLLTTSLQIGLGIEPLGGRLALPVRADITGAAVSSERPSLPLTFADNAASRATETSGPAAARSTTESLHRDRAATAPRPATTPAGTDAAASPATPDPRLDLATQISLLKGAPGIHFPSLSWGHLLLLAWVAGAAFAVARLLRGRARFLAGLGPRYPVASGAVFESLVRLRKRAGIRKPVYLTRSEHLTSPVALGHNEICLPGRALIELNRRQQEGMLAHELGHLARRDPLWLIVSGLIESLFFFQPFNMLGRRRLQESTEFLADQWAVQHTGRRLTLARSLAQVASWLEQKPQPAALAPMARLGSPLLRRIHSLLDDGAAAPAGRPRLRTAAAVLPLLAVVSLAPAVSGDATEEDGAEAKSRPALAGSPARAGYVVSSVPGTVVMSDEHGYGYIAGDGVVAGDDGGFGFVTGDGVVVPGGAAGYRVTAGGAPVVTPSRSYRVTGALGAPVTAPAATYRVTGVGNAPVVVADGGGYGYATGGGVVAGSPGFRVSAQGAPILVADDSGHVNSTSYYLTAGGLSAAPLALGAVAFAGQDGDDEPLRLEGHSNWIHNDEDRSFRMEVDGEIQFNEALDGIDSMAPGTEMVIRDDQGGNRRRLRILADDNGLPLYEYRVNGREEPFEPEGRAFLEESLADLAEKRREAQARRAEAEVRRAEAEVRRQEAMERREEVLALREEARRQRMEVSTAEREMARDLLREQERLRREMSQVDRDMRQQDRERAMAYREAVREMQSSQREEDMELRRQLRDEQREAQRVAEDAYRRAEDLMREAELADPEDRAAAVEDARAAMEEAQREVERVHEDMAQRQMELEQRREENGQRRQEDLERLQRELEQMQQQQQQEREELMEEYQRRLEEQQMEMEQRREELYQELQERQEELEREAAASGGHAMAYPDPLPPLAFPPAAAPFAEPAPLTPFPPVAAEPRPAPDAAPGPFLPSPDVALDPFLAAPDMAPMAPLPALAPSPEAAPAPPAASEPESWAVPRADEAPPAPPAAPEPDEAPAPEADGN